MPILQMRKSETKRAQLSILWIVRSEFKVRSEPDLSYFKSRRGVGVFCFLLLFFSSYTTAVPTQHDTFLVPTVTSAQERHLCYFHDDSDWQHRPQVKELFQNQ